MLPRWCLFALAFALFAGGTLRAANPEVIVETSYGNFTVELFEDKAPITVKNFLQYVDDKHYDGTIFHRVKEMFMIQGGGFEPGMKEKKVRAPIKNESDNGLKNNRGTLAMARTQALNSATAQFYINVVDNPDLDAGKYCVFGRVTQGGMDVVDKIRKVKTVNIKGHEAVPVEDIVIKSVRRVKK
jgi:cyclophilin family peptidyl-prolyl cis-trans isomerase